MTKLTVAIRVRPLSEREIVSKSVSIVSVENGKTIAVTNIKVPEQNAGDSRERIRRFTFDYCFNSNAQQEDVYGTIGKEVAKAIQKRFHSCILTYGQSSSGKTHTMIGGGDEEGFLPRLCRELFGYLSEAAVGSELKNVQAAVSYLEIYNEKVRDLLEPQRNLTGVGALKVREHPKTGPYVQGLSEKVVVNSESLLTLLHKGNANRTIGATNANPRSSRSHSLFTITCLGGLQLRFVDLAGSERAAPQSTSRFREGANINKSLVALRNVISALAEWSRSPKTKNRFVPYRDSVLTWLLKGTLGGNSKTILISTISPSSNCYNETVNTLRFGQRARQILIQPQLIEDPRERTIRELRAEIARLRELLGNPGENGESLPVMVSDNDSGLSVSLDKDKEVEEEEEEEEIFVEKLIPIMNIQSNIPSTSSSTSSSNSTLNKGFKEPKRDKVSAQRGPKPKESTRKPRSQIVAAVTQRLYNKVKKKEASTDTLDLSSPLRDLSLTSAARVRLQELTKQALKAHRRRHVETQTSLFPVVRFKEVGTEIADLAVFSGQMINVGLETDPVRNKDASTSIEQEFIGAIHLTRSCGTITDDFTTSSSSSTLSFRKYLTSKYQPVYTSLLNISVNGSDDNALSDDSLETRFPTPDLISNQPNMRYAQTNTIRAPTMENAQNLCGNLEICVANCSTEQQQHQQPAALSHQELVEHTQILKSIMKSPDDDDDETPPPAAPSAHSFENVPDSLTYYYEKQSKKVRFLDENSRQDEKMLDAMTNFMKEVTTLMSNLTKSFATRDYDLQVTINDLPPDLRFGAGVEHLCESTQTLPVSMSDAETEVDFEVQHGYNKFEALVERSCERLENTIAKIGERRDVRYQGSLSLAGEWRNGFSGGGGGGGGQLEDSSLESQPTFSDYGSLPRQRRSMMTPSGYLRQLTNMRREIVRSSRNDLMHLYSS